MTLYLATNAISVHTEPWLIAGGLVTITFLGTLTATMTFGASVLAMVLVHPSPARRR